MCTCMCAQYPSHVQNCMCAQYPSHVQLLVTQWTIASPASSVHRILPARILGWVAIPSSRESSRTRDWTHVSCVSWKMRLSRQILYHCTIWGSPICTWPKFKTAVFYSLLHESPPQLSCTHIRTHYIHLRHLWASKNRSLVKC